MLFRHAYGLCCFISTCGPSTSPQVKRLRQSLSQFLRVCPETSDRIAKFSDHEPDRGEAQERERYAVEVLPILGESSAAVEPRKRALNDPALGQHDKSLDLIGSLDDLGLHARQDFLERGWNCPSLMAGVGE